MSARRRGEPKQQQAAPPAPRVEVAFSHLPPESRAELQRALLSWVHWHAQRYLPGYVPPRVVSGKLAVEPARLLGGGLLPAPARGGANGTGASSSWALEDVPAAPQGLLQNFNASYEQEGDVPRYDRATLRPLHSASGAGKQLRAALLEAAGAAPPASLLPSARCYNCGSYGHGMGQCFRERDADAEAVSLRQREEVRAAQAEGRRYWTILLGVGPGRDDGSQDVEAAADPVAAPAAAAFADGPADDFIPLYPEQQAEQPAQPRQAAAARPQLAWPPPLPPGQLPPRPPSAPQPPAPGAWQQPSPQPPPLPAQHPQQQAKQQQEPPHWRQHLHEQQLSEKQRTNRRKKRARQRKRQEQQRLQQQGQAEGWEAEEGEEDRDEGSNDEYSEPILQQAAPAGASYTPPAPTYTPPPPEPTYTPSVPTYTPPAPTYAPSAPNHAPPAPLNMTYALSYYSSPSLYPFAPAPFYPPSANPYPFALPAEPYASWPGSHATPQQPQPAAQYGPQFGQLHWQQVQQATHQLQQQQPEAPPPPPPLPAQQHQQGNNLPATPAAQAQQPAVQTPLFPPGFGLPSTATNGSRQR